MKEATNRYQLELRLPFRVVIGMESAVRRNRLARDLRSAGCEVECAATGIDLVETLALAILNDSPETGPHLIIADLTLAGCSGFGVLEGLRQLDWHTPFFAIVDFNSEAMAQRAFQLGADRVFEKPIFPEDVKAAAMTLLLSKTEPAVWDHRRMRRPRSRVV